MEEPKHASAVKGLKAVGGFAGRSHNAIAEISGYQTPNVNIEPVSSPNIIESDGINKAKLRKPV